MDKRSWPWKKKTYVNNHPDDKIRCLNEKLVAADDLAKQHASVAEEAVSGWEKTKTEYLAMKCQLDNALEQKQAAEVRVMHLDGAFKECMLQLRQAREEQEQSIHEAVLKRSREWDKLQLDLEERLADLQRQLMDLDSQRTLLCATTQEQAEAVTKLGTIRSEAETEIKNLQAKVQTLETMNTSLKYEVVVMNKELGIRNKEVEMNTRSLEAAAHQHIESSKRIAKLESDCQRLRALVRKKLPGPGALRQMKLEVGMDPERGNACNKQSPGSRTPASPKPIVKLGSVESQARMSQRSPMLAPMSPGFHIADSFRESFMSEDAYEDDRSIVSSWTSSPVRDSIFFHGRGSTVQNSDKAFETLDSINDFLEIERLVSLPSENQGMKPAMKLGPSLSSMSEKVLTNCAKLGDTIRAIPDVSRTSLILNHSKDAACGPTGPHYQNGSRMSDCLSESSALVCKVIHIVEGLALNIMADFKSRPPNYDTNGHNETQCKVKLLLSELETSLKNFNAAGYAYLYGKAELTQFMSELYSILDELNTGPKAYKPLSSKMRWRLGVQIAEQEIISDVGSPFSSSSNSDRSDSLTRKDSSLETAPIVQVGMQASEVHTREEHNGISQMEHVIEELKQENSNLETKLQEMRSKWDSMKAKLEDSEQLVTSLRNRLTSAELSGVVAEKSLASITAAKAQLELLLQNSQHEVGRLRKKVKDLEISIEQEKRRNKEQAEALRALQRLVTSDSHNANEKNNKGQEIADATEKLAQCQRTILVLGQQLKDIVTCQDGNLAVTSHNEGQDELAKGYILNLEDTAHVPKKAFASTDLESSRICGLRTDVLATLPKVPEYALQEEAFNLPVIANPLYEEKSPTKPHRDAMKQLVSSISKPASKKKSFLYSLGAASITKSLDLDPSTAPHCKHAISFSNFFSRHKSSS